MVVRQLLGLSPRVELSAEVSHQLQGFFADVVFDPFAVGGCSFRAGAQSQQETKHDFVSTASEFSKCSTLFRQSYGTIGFGICEAVSFESCDGAIDGDVADFEEAGQIAYSTATRLPFQFGDRFNVILRQFRRVITAGSEMAGNDLTLICHGSTIRSQGA